MNNFWFSKSTELAIPIGQLTTEVINTNTNEKSYITIQFCYNTRLYLIDNEWVETLPDYLKLSEIKL